jgi:hypothetical protein
MKNYYSRGRNEELNRGYNATQDLWEAKKSDQSQLTPPLFFADHKSGHAWPKG